MIKSGRFRDESRGMFLKMDIDENGCSEIRIYGPQGGFKGFLRFNPMQTLDMGRLMTVLFDEDRLPAEVYLHEAKADSCQ